MTPVAYLNLASGIPAYRKDVRRRLRQGSDRMARQYGHHQAVLRSDRDPAVIAALRAEITGAYAARNLAAGREFSLAAWERVYGLACEVITLRVGGKLAAWALTRPGLAWPGEAVLEVMAGQMVPSFEDIFPGRAVEAFLIARAVTARYTRISWGAGHPGALIAVS